MSPPSGTILAPFTNMRIIKTGIFTLFIIACRHKSVSCESCKYLHSTFKVPCFFLRRRYFSNNIHHTFYSRLVHPAFHHREINEANVYQIARYHRVISAGPLFFLPAPRVVHGTANISTSQSHVSKHAK